LLNKKLRIYAQELKQLAAFAGERLGAVNDSRKSRMKNNRIKRFPAEVF
jgi:hypothetical protein